MTALSTIATVITNKEAKTITTKSIAMIDQTTIVKHIKIIVNQTKTSVIDHATTIANTLLIIAMITIVVMTNIKTMKKITIN